MPNLQSNAPEEKLLAPPRWWEQRLPGAWLVFQVVALVKFPPILWVAPSVVAAIWALAGGQRKLAGSFAIFTIIFAVLSVVMSGFSGHL